MGIENIEALFGEPFNEKPSSPSSRRRDKSMNTPEFNKKWKARREKAKKDAKGRKSGRKGR